MKSIKMIALLGVFLSACTPQRKMIEASQSTLERHTASSDSTQLLNDLKYLSSDALGGRGLATAGNAAAQTFIETRFTNIKLKAFGESYRHRFSIGGNKEAQNIVGWVEGETKKDSFIVISAHFDHLGTLNNQIYNGADDNASGTAALLALAQYFAQNPPQHSLIFVAFDAEESGLLGAYAFVKNPPIPLSQVKLNLNMDMIGRNKDNTLNICGTYPYPQLKPLIEPLVLNQPISFTLAHDKPTDTGANHWVSASDHGAFHDKGIPFLYFGVEDHEDYHKITDDFERIMPSFYYQAVQFIQRASKHLDERL